MYVTTRYTLTIIVIAMMMYITLWRLYIFQTPFCFKECLFKQLSSDKNLNTTLGFDHIYVINSLSQISRRERIQEMACKLGLEFDLFLAYTPENSKSALNRFNPNSNLPLDNKATYLNHYRVYQSIVHNGYNNALILEDVVDIEFNITSIMHNIHRILPANWDLLYLGYCNGWEGAFSHPLPDDNGPSIYKLFKSKRPYCTHAYAVSSSGAFKLLQRLIPTTLPIDLDLINMIQSDQVNSYTIVPPPIVQLCAPSEGNPGPYYLKNSTANLVTKKSVPLNDALGFSIIYIVNYSNKPGRREKLEAIASKLNLHLAFILPRDLDYDLQSDHKAYHKIAYQSIANQKQDSALILEDGVDLEFNIKYIMTDVHRILPADWEILYLGHCSDLEGESGHSLSVTPSYNLFKSKKPYCSHAYAVSYVGALKILQELTKQSELPIDIELVNMIEQESLISYTLIPPVTSQWYISDNPSDNYPGKKNIDLFQLKHSTLRSLGLNHHESNSTLGFSHIYVINLLSRPDRREKLEKLANKFNLNFEFFPAVSYNDTEALDEFNPKVNMRPTHKACYISHYKIYQSILQRGYMSALILEDDVDFELNIASIVNNALHILPPDWEIFYVGFCSNFEGRFEPLPDEDNILSDHKIFKSDQPYCLHGYALSRAGVLKLIKELAKPTGMPIDLELVYMIERGDIIAYSLVPPAIMQWRSPNNPSDISPGAKALDYHFLKNSSLRFLGVLKESNFTLGFNKIYVINHSDQSNRREKLEVIAVRLFLNLDFFNIKILDHPNPNTKDYLRWRRWIHHYDIYKSIIEHQYGSALILEDNIDFEVNIASIMTDVHRILPPDWEILYLGHCSSLEGKFNPLPDSNNNSSTYKLFKSERPRCVHAYAVSNAGARKLLEKLENPTVLPIGLELSNMIRLGEITSYTIIPPIIVQSRSDGQTSDYYILKNSTKEFIGIEA